MESVKFSHVIRKIKFFLLGRYYYLREIISPSKIKSAKAIPIIINNFNRIFSLKKLIEGLERTGYTNIYIIDNNSTYQPLLEYYKKCRYKIFLLKENVGYKALWKTDISKLFCNDYYIYTDSDLALVDACPDDFIDYLFLKLKQYKFAPKIGLSLRLDNIPAFYNNKKQVIEWETKYYTNANPEGLFRAPIDTTFALYRPRVGLSRSRFVESYRTPFPYQAEHLPWYNDSEHLNKEDKYYINHCKAFSSWSSK